MANSPISKNQNFGAVETMLPTISLEHAMRASSRLLVAMILTGPCSLIAAPPDLILHHGKIVTVDKQFSVLEAIAIEGNKIALVGKNDNVLAIKGEATKLVDLQGKMVLPGLIDSHTHPT